RLVSVHFVTLSSCSSLCVTLLLNGFCEDLHPQSFDLTGAMLFACAKPSSSSSSFSTSSRSLPILPFNTPESTVNCTICESCGPPRLLLKSYSTLHLIAQTLYMS